MDNFEEKFLEELAKARARLEGKEPYDDESIEKEFTCDEEPVKKNTPVRKSSAKATVKKEAPKETIQVIQESVKEEIEAEPKKINDERLAVIFGGVSVAISFILSCLGLIVDSDSYGWQAFEAYMPFIGIVCGSAAVICGALLIKEKKKGSVPLILGLLAIFIAVFVSAIT